MRRYIVLEFYFKFELMRLTNKTKFDEVKKNQEK